MIDPKTGMKPGERYVVESLERTQHFPGFFLDGKYYLGPELTINSTLPENRCLRIGSLALLKT